LTLNASVYQGKFGGILMLPFLWLGIALMGNVWRIALATACVAGGAAWAQIAPEMPPYDKAYASVTDAGCDRVEAADFIRFKCNESGALWYFTREGQPAYPSYIVGPADEKLGLLLSGGGPVHSNSREAAQASWEARRKWLQDIAAVWQADTADGARPTKRDGGMLYRNDD
jgi:hypothetical protein